MIQRKRCREIDKGDVILEGSDIGLYCARNETLTEGDLKTPSSSRNKCVVLYIQSKEFDYAEN